LIQNASADRFLRLLDDDYVLHRLRRIEETVSQNIKQTQSNYIENPQDKKARAGMGQLRGFVRDAFERVKDSAREAAAVFPTPAIATASDGTPRALPEKASFDSQALGAIQTEQGKITFLDAGDGKTHVRLSPATPARALLLNGHEYPLVGLNQDAGEFLVEGLNAGDADMFIVAHDHAPGKNEINWR
jgi:preprotein translocase subunit SecA